MVMLGYIKNSGTAQQGLVNTHYSPHAAMKGVNLGDVQWTTGFWAERFAVCRDAMLPAIWNTYTSKEICFSFQNFRVAAGLDTGRYRGPSFHDGDFYKVLEAVASMYAATRQPMFDKWMDEAIEVIGKAQRPDGYIYTKNIIEQRKTGQEKMFDDQLSFEAYNLGHLMTAACVHYRATGKNTLLQIAEKAANFLIGFYQKATPELARNAICPSHYMGLTELYRTTRLSKYLELANYLINIRGTVEGTDDNSDRAPFRQMQKVVGHAVRANYLFAGVADVIAETGDTTLMQTLKRLWDNVTLTKMYITGGCGALYDGVSVDGTSYKPDTVQKVHQAYGRDFQLPALSAHNETCANIGNVLWNWRMFLLTGQACYVDIVELALYNSVLSGVSMNGLDYFYTNPLAYSHQYPYQLRWQGGRVPYISKSNCCPPNVVRTLAQVNNYLYTFSGNQVYVNMYAANRLKTKLEDGSPFEMEQITDYPWNGKVSIKVKTAGQVNAIFLRMPAWCKSFSLVVNGKAMPQLRPNAQGYIAIQRVWKNGDEITYQMEMPANLLESNPWVEESRNRVAVKRGPLVYCLEAPDVAGAGVFEVMIPAGIKLQPVEQRLGNGRVMVLQGQAKYISHEGWNRQLYREVNTNMHNIPIKLIPYYAWANRGYHEMTVWMPLLR